jgi:hypothetical protein
LSQSTLPGRELLELLADRAAARHREKSGALLAQAALLLRQFGQLL